MIRLTLVWGALLLAGTSMIEIYASLPSSALVQSSTSAPTLSPTSTTTVAPKSSNQTTQTTHAPTNTTTHAPTNTTTHAPTNTTTHAPTNTTTHAPTNTTTHAPSNTTMHPTTTPVLPTKPSPPTTGDYRVKHGNSTCVIADMGLAFELGNSTTLTQVKNAKGIWYFNVNPEKTTSTGTCGNTTATLNLEFPQGSIHFGFIKDKKVYYINEVFVNFSWSSAEHWNGTSGNLKLLSTEVGYSVKCKNTPTVKLASNLQLTMANVKLQAFDITNDVFGKEEVCYPDRNKMLVAVGIALAVVGLILIILLVVLLTRRRRSSGYERI